MRIYEILVPYKMGKRNVPVPYHQEWDAKVKAITGGLTIGRVNTGYWVDDKGKTIRELMIPVRIACTKKQFKKILIITKKHYNQDKVFGYEISKEVYIV